MLSIHDNIFHLLTADMVIDCNTSTVFLIFTCHSHFHVLSMLSFVFCISIEGSACNWRCTLATRRRASSPSSSLLCSPASLFRWRLRQFRQLRQSLHDLFWSVTMPIANEPRVRTWALDTTSHCGGLAISTGRFSLSRSSVLFGGWITWLLGIMISFIFLSVWCFFYI